MEYAVAELELLSDFDDFTFIYSGNVYKTVPNLYGIIGFRKCLLEDNIITQSKWSALFIQGMFITSTHVAKI